MAKTAGTPLILAPGEAEMSSGQPGLLREFQTSQGYTVGFYFKKKTKIKKTSS